MIVRDVSSAYGAFQSKCEQTLCLYCEFHRQFVHYFLCIAVDNKAYGFFGGNATLVAVEYLILGDL